MNYLISIYDMFAVTLLCLGAGVLSYREKIKLDKVIYISSIRALTQLLLFGFVLKIVFGFNEVWQVLLVCLAMTIFAIISVKFRLPNKKETSSLSLFISVCLSSWFFGILLVYFMYGSVKFEAITFIPLLGMLLGNSLNGITLGLQRVQIEVHEKKDIIISQLGLGKTLNESTETIKKSAMQSALTPILNSMSIVGIVSFPGLMTGKVLSGVDPIEASKAQFLILTFIFLTLYFGCLAGVKTQIKKYFPEGIFLSDSL